MNTNDVRNTITSKLEQESSSHDYMNLARTRLGEAEAQEVFDFTISYLRNSADLMDEVYAAASAARCLSTFQPIFDASFAYWSNEYDFIPDSLGIAGICDDAYLSMMLMQMVANARIPSTNQVLMPEINQDLVHQNEFMAYLLGPDVANQLNSVALQTFQSIHIQETINNLLSAAAVGTLFGGGSMSMMHNALEQNRIDEQVNVQLGAMGIF